MQDSLKLCLVLLAAALPWAGSFAAAGKQTVCTITVNSADEKEAFARHLPPAQYEFVELVEPGRSDWLASACRAAVACDVLIVSGHFDGSSVFFSDRLEVREHLPVAELERVSCSASCPTLFARLKEVYLFGCNTLNPQPQSGATAEIVRSLVREGHSPRQAQRQLQSLAAAHGESSRDRMRQIFEAAPEIYGFSSTAPLGPIAGATLDRYFRSTGAREVAHSRVGDRLLGHFAPFGMSMARGITDKGPHAQARDDMCRFADERLSVATRLSFVHELLQRHVGEARLHLDRIQRLIEALADAERRSPVVAQVLEDIARDGPARERFLGYARGAQEPPVRTRLLEVAHSLGWLSQDERRQELALMLGELLARTQLGVAEVGLACELNEQGDLDGTFDHRVTRAGAADDVAHAAVRACLGSAEGRARTLQGLLGADAADVQIAQAYLRHRPVGDDAELRRLADGITRMDAGDAQVRALEALARHYVADRGVLDRLIDLYGRTSSFAVQSAIAGILIRADRRSIASAQLVHFLREHRHPAPAGGHGDDIIDALIRTLAPP